MCVCVCVCACVCARVRVRVHARASMFSFDRFASFLCNALCYLIWRNSTKDFIIFIIKNINVRKGHRKAKGSLHGRTERLRNR